MKRNNSSVIGPYQTLGAAGVLDLSAVQQAKTLPSYIPAQYLIVAGGGAGGGGGGAPFGLSLIHI